MEKIKLRGGPMNNKYYDLDSWTERFVVRTGKYKDRFRFDGNPYAPVEVIEGHYSRSNMKLKNGAVIYIWMGWKDEV